MSCKRASKRSLDEWMEMVTACRQSGMTDADWCAEHGIASSSFYNAVTRLRKQACQIQIRLKKPVLWILHPVNGMWSGLL